MENRKEEMRKIVLILSLFSFASGGVAQIPRTFKIRKDTLRVNYLKCQSLSKQNGYFRYGNLNISNDYKIVDSTGIINKGQYRILVLSPLDQEQETFNFPCQLDVRRILLVYDISKPIGNGVLYVNDNIILNKFDFLSDPYIRNAKSAKNGFILSFSIGSRIRCDITLYFSVNTKKIYLTKYIMDYYTIDLKHSKIDSFLLKRSNQNELTNIETLSLIRFPNW